MAKLGSPATSKFSIGTAEVRVGPLHMAGRLTQANSIGLLDDVTVSISQESATLQGGFPRVLVDSAIISQTATISATMREFSRRNMRMVMGEGVDAVEPADISTTLAADATAEATTITLASGTGILPGDVLVIYPDGQPENVSLVKVAQIAAAVVTLHPDTKLLMPYLVPTAQNPRAAVNVYVSRTIAIGAVAETKYMAVTVIQRENSTGRPTGYQFWKASVSSGMEHANNPEDYASMSLELSVLQPTLEDVAAGGVMAHLAHYYDTNPTGMYFIGGESTTGGTVLNTEPPMVPKDKNK